MQYSDIISKKGKKGSALLLHGLGGTPENVRPLASFLIKLGFSVDAPLLPGHGTSIENLKNIKYYDLYNFCEKRLKALNQKKPIILAGSSMGGTIALDLASKNKVNALITSSAPLFINGFYNGRLIVAQPLILFSYFFSKFRPVYRRTSANAYDPEKQFHGYRNEYSTGTIHSLKTEMKRIRKEIASIQCPYLSIMSRKDQTISYVNQNVVMERCKSKHQEAIFLNEEDDHTGHHNLFTHEENLKIILPAIKSFLERVI